MKVGIIFGGTGGARESSYASGRTVYDNLDKSLFEAVPIFVDSLGNFILLDWQHMYKAGIRNFYPPTEVIPASEHQLPVYIESLGDLSPEHQTEIIRRVGQRIFPSEFKNYFSFAFLALPDFSAGEASLQRLLTENNIPHSGPGISAAAICTNRLSLKQELAKHGFPVTPFEVISAETWAAEDNREELFTQLQHALSLPLVIRAAGQSAPGRSIVITENNFNRFAEGLEQSLGQKTVYKEKWQALPLHEQLALISQITDIQTGIGLPVRTRNGTVLHHPEQLHQVINRLFTETDLRKLTLYAVGRREAGALVEAAPAEIYFSCSVIRDETGAPLALAPEIKLKKEKTEGPGVLTFEEETGKSRFTPVQLAQIRQECQRCYLALDIAIYACLHGFITEANEIYLEEVQIAPEMLPTALVFRQAAVIGLNPTQLLTLLIRSSLARHREIIAASTRLQLLLNQLDAAILEGQQQRQRKTKVGIIMGGDSEGAGYSVAGGRYIYQLLAASEKYHPVPIIRLGPTEQPRYHILPLHVLWQAATEAISEKIMPAQERQDDLLEKVRAAANNLTITFAGPLLREPQFIPLDHLNNLVDVVFISLPEQEAVNGVLQAELEKLKLAYTGSGPTALRLAQNKAQQQALWRQQGLIATEEFSAELMDELHSGDLIRELEVTGNLLTRHLPDGRLDYEIFQTTAAAVAAGINQEEEFPESNVGSFFPANYSPDQIINQQIFKEVEAYLKKAAQVLNIQSYAQLKVLVRIKENHPAEITIQKVSLFPALTVAAEIFQGAALLGYTPYNFIDCILQFALERQKTKVHGHRHTQF